MPSDRLVSKPSNNRTLYVADKDFPLWDQAVRCADARGTGISALILDLLRDHLDRIPKCDCGLAIVDSWQFCPGCGKDLRAALEGSDAE